MPGSAAGWAGFMAGYLARTTAVLTLALIAAAAARRRPAAFRHFLLSSALIGLLLLPLLTLAPLEWRSPLVPAWMAAPAPHTGDGAAVDGTRRPSPASQIPPGPGREDGPRAAGLGPAAEGGPAAGEPLVLAETMSLVAWNIEGRTGAPRPAAIPVEPGTVAPRERTAGGERQVVLGSLLAVLWAAGVMVLVLRLAFGLNGAVRLTAESTPLDTPAWRALLERFLALLSLRREVRLRSHPKVLVPLAWGWRKPFVLLPEGTEAWSDDERSSALSHELSHIKRRDALVMPLVRVSLAVFWWNPLCWIVYRELLKEQEVACDELVLRAGIRPSTYAASLLAFRRSARHGWSPSAAWLGILGRSSFQERVAAILKQKLILMEVKMKTKIMLAASLGLAVALIGTARPAAAEGPSGPAAAVEAAPVTPEAPAVSAQAEALGPVEVQETQQEKAKAEEKAKAAEKAAKEQAAAEKQFVVKAKEGGKSPLVITITEGGEAKTLVLEKPLTITRSKDGDAIVLTIDGQDVQVLRGKPLRLEIKGGELQIVREPGLVKVGEGGVVKIVKEGEGEGKTVVFVGTAEPKVAVEKIKIAEGEASPEVFVKMRKDQKPGETWVQAVPVDEAKSVVVKEGEPAVVWTVKEGSRPIALAADAGKDMLDRVRALQEQVQAIKAKKMDIAALEESLKKLEAELMAKAEKIKELKLKLETSPSEYTVVKRVEGPEGKGKAGVWVMTESKTAQEAKVSTFIGIGDKGERTINLMLTGQEGEAGKAVFERVRAKLQERLPEGYKIEGQDYDAEKGLMTFKISAPEGRKTDETLVRKLVESLKDALKSTK